MGSEQFAKEFSTVTAQCGGGNFACHAVRAFRA